MSDDFELCIARLSLCEPSDDQFAIVNKCIPLLSPDRMGYEQGWGQVQLTKYSSTSSTPNIYQVQVLVKYSFF